MPKLIQLKPRLRPVLRDISAERMELFFRAHEMIEPILLPGSMTVNSACGSNTCNGQSLEGIWVSCCGVSDEPLSLPRQESQTSLGYRWRVESAREKSSFVRV